ncbi:chordin-like isoform X2 [Ruditapes philippinarum]|uniref:chordin-like isoform X2 n=1 Tax=Ruditapes philippinarum TaxID=129788 RepID=UPI00295B9DA3|nr:chordin-like isoform X2 [Ruditapes philippinarum]
MNRIVISAYTLLTIMCVLVDCGCVFQGEVYPVGETWHPATFGTCVNCTCEINERGESDVRCVNTADKCPKLNCPRTKKDPHSCCPYCEVSASEDESNSYKRANCTGPGGRIYRDGERYASNSTGLVPTTDKQCVLCICQDGTPLCYLKTCLVPKTCSKLVQKEDDCCPVCADFPVATEKDVNDCSDSSGIKPNGTQWHPTVESVGEIDCITCTCLNGEIKCQKDCLPDHELPCRHPKKPNGACCKTCPEKKDRKKNKKRDRKNKNRKGKGKGNKRRKGKKKRKCKGKDKDKDSCKNRRRRRKERTTTQAVKPTAVVGISLENLCIRKKTVYLVYKSITDTELLIAFDDIKANTVDVHTWTVNKENQRGVITYTEPKVVSSTEFRKTINNTNVVGTAGKSQYRKFKRRLKDKLEKCEENCEPELFIKIIQKVKVRLLKFGDEC